MTHDKDESNQKDSACSGKPYEAPEHVELNIAETKLDSNPGDDGLGIFTQS